MTSLWTTCCLLELFSLVGLLQVDALYEPQRCRHLIPGDVCGHVIASCYLQLILSLHRWNGNRWYSSLSQAANCLPPMFCYFAATVCEKFQFLSATLCNRIQMTSCRMMKQCVCILYTVCHGQVQHSGYIAEEYFQIKNLFRLKIFLD